MVPLEGYTIAGEGKGGAAGFAKGEAAVALADGEDGGTLLSYNVKANVGGKLAQLGSRLIDGFAKKMADAFFENFAVAVEPPAEAGGGVGRGGGREEGGLVAGTFSARAEGISPGRRRLPLLSAGLRAYIGEVSLGGLW